MKWQDVTCPEPSYNDNTARNTEKRKLKKEQKKK